MKHLSLKQNLSLTLFLSLFIWSCNGQKSESVLSPENFQFRLKANSEAQLVDVRTQGEFASGHLANAINLDFYSSDFEKSLGGLSKEKPVYVYCKVGGRSHDAASIMRKGGFKQVFELDGGIMKWNAAGLPLDGRPTDKPDKISPSDFEQQVSSAPLVLVDFYAPWCGPCKRMEPMLEKFKAEWKGKIEIQRLNVDEATAVCKSLKVEAIPVFVLYSGGKVAKRLDGEQSAQSLKDWLKEELKN